MFETTHREFLDPAVLTRLGGLPLFARKPMLGNVSGRHRSPHRGSSIEFAEYRKYVPGDDPRRLDWRAYARSDRFFVKEFEADTNLRLCLVLDASGSMGYQAHGITKLDYGKRIAATLGYLAAKQGDAVGLTCAADKIRWDIPPRRNPAHLRNVYDTLAKTKAQGDTGLVPALHAIAETAGQRALVVIISDLFVPSEQLFGCFQHLRFRKHDVAIFHLLEDAELDFDFDRPTRFIDLEGGPHLLVEPSAIRREYHTALRVYFDELNRAIRESAMDYQRIRIEEHYGDVLARFLVSRKPRGRATMTFLQPMLLIGLPLVALPIVIHLINLRRHRTVRWGAMMFLLAATRQKRGRTRLRHLLILAARMLGIAGLIFAISRPMAGGWFGLFGGRPDTVIVVLDRSASMSQQDVQSGQSKRSRAVQQIADALQRAGAPPNLVLIESGTNKPQPVSSPDALLEMPNTGATDGAANVPTMLNNALDYLIANKAGRTDIWICSDVQGSDWNPDSGGWEAIRSGFRELPQTIRFHLLTYDQPAPENFSIRVTKLRRQRADDGHRLVMDVNIRRLGSASQHTNNSAKIPLEIVVDGARSVIDVEIEGDSFVLAEHVVPIDGQRPSGWGKVELPNDANPRDNVYFFSYGDDTIRRAVVVTDQPGSAWPLSLAAAPPAEKTNSTADVIRPEDVPSIEWNKTALILWQAPLPRETAKTELQQFVASGGNVIFFPPPAGNDGLIFGTSWGVWRKLTVSEEPDIEDWRDDSGLLAQSDGGSPLPVDRLSIREYRQVNGNGHILARVRGGDPLLTRIPTDAGGVYFSATLPQQPFSNLARQGIVFFVMVQRALDNGVARLLRTQLGTIGDRLFGLERQAWTRVEGWQEGSLSTQQEYVAGVYRVGDLVVARNRPETEDITAPLNSGEIDRLLNGLDYRIVLESIDGPSSLVSEIWRAFVVVLVLALIAEACLCLPDVRPKKLVAA